MLGSTIPDGCRPAGLSGTETIAAKNEAGLGLSLAKIDSKPKVRIEGYIENKSFSP